MTPAELYRRLSNIVQVGTISSTKNKVGKALGRVTLDDSDENKRVSAFLPVLSLNNSFIKVWVPLRVGEQVLVISPFGNANSGFIIRSIFNKGCKEPVGSNEHTTIMEFEDGTKLSYDSKSSELKMDVVKTINIICVDANIKASNSVNIETNTAYLKASDTTIESTTLIKGTLTVTDLFSAKGGMKVSPSADGSVAAEFDCDIKTTGSISDKKGDVTSHGHETTDGARAVNR